MASPQQIVQDLGAAAKQASYKLSSIETEVINQALNNLADEILGNIPFILSENAKDIEAGKAKALSDAMLDRLLLNEERIASIAEGARKVASLDDPTDKVLWETLRPNGLTIKRVSAPIGVLGMIYESRPNVTVDAAALCLKSHNAVILRGGSESLHSSLAFHEIIQAVLKKNNIPKEAVSMVPTPDRAAVGAMLSAHEYIDVLIPRGGKSLIERVMNDAKMPVFGHLEGLCHIYVDKDADTQKALNVTLNAKLRRTGICGAMETLLLDDALEDDIARDIVKQLLDQGCEIVGDEKSQLIDPRIKPAKDNDWHTEYLDAKLSVKFVDGLYGAVEHINHYGSHHTESIITENKQAAEYFLKNVDSGIVMHNASTQFADGGEFGMGAEIGIATGKMHARGPVGLEQLCTYKYRVYGDGQTRP